jgi:hypothetical protein
MAGPSANRQGNLDWYAGVQMCCKITGALAAIMTAVLVRKVP